MLRRELAEKLSRAVARLVADGRLPAADYPEALVEDTKSPEHGDFATNFALAAAKKAGLKPREVGEALAAELGRDPDFEKVEVAGPGFVNLTLSPACTARALGAVLADPEGFYRSVPERPLKINVEFVSVNPNGPITIGSGRGAAYGSTLCNVLEAAGHTVHREYYINDGVNSEQMRLFAESVKAILESKPVPENGYKGDYVSEVAAQLADQSDRSVLAVQSCAQKAMLAKQRSDLAAFGVEFDTWFSEQSLHDSGAVSAEIDHLVKTGAADDEGHRVKVKFGKGGTVEDVEIEPQATDEDDENPLPLREAEGEGAGGRGQAPEPTRTSPDQPELNTLWLRSTKFGDDMDRVLRRRDGRLTYIASDVAYHKDKFNRPRDADRLITVLGPDHHGYIGRLHAVVAAVLMGESKVESRKSKETGKEQGQGSGVKGQGEFSDLDAKIWRDASEKAACMDALVEARQKLQVLIFQLVRFVKDGKPAPMRKRDGNVYALIDLINEIGEKVQPNGSSEERQRAGRDVARFFYLMRSHDTTFDFDLDLAERQSEDNPVFYAQYAHARICGVVEKAREAGLVESRVTSHESRVESRKSQVSSPESRGESHESGVESHESRVTSHESRVESRKSKVESIDSIPDTLAMLTHPKEKALVLKLQDLPFEVERCAEDYAVNRLATYAVELARTYHHFYDACRVIQPDQPDLSRARLALCLATRAALRATFTLLGVSAPEKM